MKFKYDFHIHTALSPCAVDDMTANNIVNMAILSGLDIIAITDHNSCKNAWAVQKAAKNTSLLVLAGLEVESVEEVHCICIFPDLTSAEKMQAIVYRSLPKPRPAVRERLKKNKKIFGRQDILDENDEVLAQETELLSFSSSISIDDLIKIVNSLSGILIPAHVDRPSNSIISNLGEIPEYMSFTTIEISRFANIEEYKHDYPNVLIIQDSDSHELGFIGICERELELDELNPMNIINLLKGTK